MGAPISKPLRETLHINYKSGSRIDLWVPRSSSEMLAFQNVCEEEREKPVVDDYFDDDDFLQEADLHFEDKIIEAYHRSYSRSCDILNVTSAWIDHACLKEDPVFHILEYFLQTAHEHTHNAKNKCQRNIRRWLYVLEMPRSSCLARSTAHHHHLDPAAAGPPNRDITLRILDLALLDSKACKAREEVPVMPVSNALCGDRKIID